LTKLVTIEFPKLLNNRKQF